MKFHMSKSGEKLHFRCGSKVESDWRRIGKICFPPLEEHVGGQQQQQEEVFYWLL